MHQNPFRPRNASGSHFGEKNKKTGLCGAPQCHCTPLLLAMCVALAGLILVGVGSCVVGFLGNDNTPKALGSCLIVIGLVMMVVGAAFYVHDTYFRARFPIRQSVGYTYHPQESTRFEQHQPSTSYGAAGPSSPSKFHGGQKGNLAPPAYDSVLEEKSEEPRQPGKTQGGRNKSPLVV